MKVRRIGIRLTLAAFLLSTGMSYAQDIDATETMKQSHLAYFYAADDGLAEVIMTIVDKKGRERIREFSIFPSPDRCEPGNWCKHRRLKMLCL